jgi:hypothetical protein
MRRRKGINEVVLNVRKLESLRPVPGQERTEYWDVGLRGFGVRVAASGRKTFTVRYVLRGKQDRRDIGVYQVTASYAGARAEAERIISEARNGRDPFASVALLKKADIDTFEGLCQRYLEDPAPGRKGRVLAAETRKGMTRIINKELIPTWGAREPNSIQPEEIGLVPAYRHRRRPAETGPLSGESILRLHGHDLLVGGTQAALALHAVRRTREAVRRAEAEPDVQQR